MVHLNLSCPAEAMGILQSPPPAPAASFFLLVFSLKCRDLNVSVCILCLSAGRTQCGRLPEDGMRQPHSSRQTLLQGAVTNNDTAKPLPCCFSLPTTSHKRQAPHTSGLKHFKTLSLPPKYSVLFGEFPVFSLLPVLPYSVCPVFKNGLFVSQH